MTCTDEQEDPRVELAQWLCEVGKRRWPHGPQAQRAPLPPPGGAKAPPRRPALHRLLLLLGLLAGAYLHYFYMDVLLEITSLRALIVWVTAGTIG